MLRPYLNLLRPFLAPSKPYLNLLTLHLIVFTPYLELVKRGRKARSILLSGVKTPFKPRLPLLSHYLNRSNP